MLNEDERRRGAEEILRAEREGKPVPQLSKTFPAMEIADAYRVQDIWAEQRIAKGARVVGHKIGLTSRAMQLASKMTEPDYGRILDDALFNDGAKIPTSRFIKPRLGVELAFVMGEDLGGPGVRIHDVLRATEFVVPALEIIDYRTEVPRAIVDTIADNAAFGAIVLGGRTIRPFDVDIRWVGATLSQNGIIEEIRGLGSHHGTSCGRHRLAGEQTSRRRCKAAEGADCSSWVFHEASRYYPR